ncbi:MAG TPA: DinB family protein [Blastocatellia bacterium]|nr:DinB family protein [Blastocatellia bacterium]
MKKVFGLTLATLLVALGGAAAQAQELSKADRDRALAYLETTKKNIVEATRGLSEAQWNVKPSPFKWSVAQVMEHIAASEDYIRGIIENQVMKAPPAPDRDLREIDSAVLARVPDRSITAQAPGPLRPTNRFATPEAALKHFLESRAKTEELLKNTPDLRAHAVDSQLAKKLDAYEFILVIAAHSERRTKQLLEVKANASFPKK